MHFFQRTEFSITYYSLLDLGTRMIFFFTLRRIRISSRNRLENCNLWPCHILHVCVCVCVCVCEYIIWYIPRTYYTVKASREGNLQIAKTCKTRTINQKLDVKTYFVVLNFELWKLKKKFYLLSVRNIFWTYVLIMYTLCSDVQINVSIE